MLDDFATQTPLPRSVIALLGDRLVKVAQLDIDAAKEPTKRNLFKCSSFVGG